jgi:hypothetical protein
VNLRGFRRDLRCGIDGGVLDAIHALRAAGRTRLADLVAEHGDERVEAYASRVFSHRPTIPLEPALEAAFLAEVGRLGWSVHDRERARADLVSRRVVQTATHLTASEGPTFLAVHAVALSGLPSGAPYLVGTFSGVPFSNPAWSGCLNFSARYALENFVDGSAPVYRELARSEADRKRDGVAFDRRISLIPSSLRDGLVFGSRVTEQLRRVVAALIEPVVSISPEPGDDFGPWALGFCQATIRRALACERIGFFDLNACVAGYLTRVLPDSEHPMTRLLFDQQMRDRVTAAFGHAPTWFYTEVNTGKRARVAACEVRSDVLRGPGLELPFTPEAVASGLAAGRLCPAVLPCFVALTVLSGVRCLGSFEQVEYLPHIVRSLSEAGFEPAADLDPEETAWLTTGRALGPDGQPVYPLDVVLGTPMAVDPNATVWDWLAPLMPRLLKGR